MRFRSTRTRSILLLVLAFVPLLAVTVWSASLPQPKNQPVWPVAVEKSVSGKISSIGDASFTVDVEKNQNVVKVPFLIDDSTKIEGKLQVGLTAQVDFRTEDGNNIAMNVKVQPAGLISR